MRFDPAALHFMRVQEVPLAPDAASVGLEIRVIGNDSGEKVCLSRCVSATAVCWTPRLDHLSITKAPRASRRDSISGGTSQESGRAHHIALRTTAKTARNVIVCDMLT